MTINKYIEELLKDKVKLEDKKYFNSLIKNINFNDYKYLDLFLNKMFTDKLDIRIKGSGNCITLEGSGETLTCIISMFKNISFMVKCKNIDKKEILDLFKYYLNK